MSRSQAPTVRSQPPSPARTSQPSYPNYRTPVKRSSSAHDLHNVSAGLVSFSSPAHYITDLEASQAYDTTDFERSQALSQYSNRSSALNQSDTFERLFDQARYELEHRRTDKKDIKSDTLASFNDEETIQRSEEADKPSEPHI